MDMRYLLAISLVMSAAACGDDDAPPPPKPGQPGAPGGPAKPAGPPPPKFVTRMRVEDRVLDPDEKKGIRHQFRDRDFVLDQTNRDPFQSFVLNQGLTNPNDKVTIVTTPKCTRDDQFVASNYSYTDLRLVGIVAQGTQRKVLMMDPGNLGHIIRRGDCVGREKAKVKDVGTGYITFEVTPDETGAGGTVKQGEERSIQLYPNQMPISSQPQLDNEGVKSNTPDVAPPTSAPPPSNSPANQPTK